MLEDLLRLSTLDRATHKGDAHLKSSIVVYGEVIWSANARPAFDLVSTIPCALKDAMVLMLNGSLVWAR